MCQSMFCAIPCPIQIWDEDAKDKMLLFLPIVGLEIGAIWVFLAWLCSFLNLPALLTGLILCVWPFLATGQIHLDGFMDVTDAVGSYRTLERRREILKDSHVGSFAVIGVCLLLLCQFALFSSLPQGANYLILLLIPMVSRCCSALAVALLKPMSTSQYAERKTDKGYTYFDVEDGLLYCENCMSNSMLFPLDIGLIKALRHIAFSDFEKIYSFKMEENALPDLSYLTEKYLLSKLQRNFKTLEFYNSIKV